MDQALAAAAAAEPLELAEPPDPLPPEEPDELEPEEPEPDEPGAGLDVDDPAELLESVEGEPFDSLETAASDPPALPRLSLRLSVR